MNDHDHNCFSYLGTNKMRATDIDRNVHSDKLDTVILHDFKG